MSPFGLFVVIIGLILSGEYAFACYRKPQGASGDPSPVDENYQILISGNPATYHPGRQYNITLACDPMFKFISFTLLLEAEEPGIIANHEMLGTFIILDTAETKFSDVCNNLIESNNNNIKDSISVAWIAPSSPQSGCVLFKAAVLQQRNVWFLDGGFLTRRLCPEEIDEVNSLTPQVNPCCACDEAKYEIILERKWTRNSHAKHFPLEAWRTRLGDVIGASHSVDYKFWEYGKIASPGLKQLAEHGATEVLEEEIKYDSSANGGVRTIIKAPGVGFKSNVVTKTLANVRVSPTHHMISLVSKIEPSPDWILGVASLELCLANCTWVDKKILNLFPWDVGTDAGPSYMSADQPQKPPDVIRRIASNYPNDVRSPFYDETGAPMNPMATLKITRKRTYERPCVDVDIGGYRECATHPWNDWTECSAKCGSGKQFRERSFKTPAVANKFPNCTEVRLRQIRTCVGNQCGPPQGSDSRNTIAECELRPWSQWTPCSKKCGKGYQTRSRDYVSPFVKDKCQGGVAVELQQTRTCSGDSCGGNIVTSAYDNMDSGMYPGNFDGNSDSNSYLGSSYDNQRTNANRYRDSQKPSQQEFNSYGNLNINSYDSTNIGSQNSKPLLSGIGNTDYDGTENIYGSEQLKGGYGNQPLFGDLETSYDDDNQFGNFGNMDRNIKTSRFGNINRYENKDNQLIPAPNYRSNDRFQIQNKQSNRFTDTTTSGRYGDPASNNNQNGQSDRFGDNTNSYQSQYDPSNIPAYNQKSHATSPLSYGTSRYATTARTNFYNVPSSPFENTYYGTNNQDQNPNAEKNYCMQKPMPYPTCNKKRIIIKNYWFFDAEDGQCKLFTADNCDQNKNKFFSLESCELACASQEQSFGNDPDMNQGFQNAGFEQSNYGVQKSWG